mgnify:CR=1 FL=1
MRGVGGSARMPTVAGGVPVSPRGGFVARPAGVRVAAEAIGEPDDGVVVVAHSLGTVAALLALAQHAPATLRGLVLVAPFWEPIASSPELDAFVDDLPGLEGALAGTPVVVVDHGEPKIQSAIAEVRARGGFVITIGGEGSDIPALGGRGTGGLAWGAMAAPWGPLEAVVPLQMLARELALQLGCDVDKPRNLAKSVTVE